ncbi:Family of serine hydrolases 3 [Coemansia sp. RSA 1933]|nr:Family of serine hydrolases 3 [Coemansia sp. RSA 1933]
MSKPKILCLHGFGESGELFKIRSRNFRRIVEDHAELVYLDGHLDIANLHLTAADLDRDNSIHTDFTNLAWWWARKSKTTEYRGMEKAFLQIGKVLNEQGPFDGILAFSQGACLGIIISALLDGRSRDGGSEFGIEVNHPPIKFMVLAGAFLINDPGYQFLYSKKLNIPSFHMSGEYDTVISRSEAHAANNVFVDPVVFDFVGGHYIPQTPQCNRAMAEFVAPFIPGVQLIPQPVAQTAAEMDVTPSSNTSSLEQKLVVESTSA